MDTENKLTVVRGEGVGGLGEKDEGIKKREQTHRHRPQYGD